MEISEFLEILTMLGFELGEDFDVVNLGYGLSADALQNRRIAGMFLARGIPTGALTHRPWPRSARTT